MAADKRHILLIDDDLDMHEVIRLVLEPLGFRVSCATTVPAGVGVLESDPVDLLLLDIMLATPSEGLELADRIRADEKLSDLPIILVSSAPQMSALEAHRDGGVARPRPGRFLEKPLDARQLRQAVAEAMDGNEGAPL